MKTHARTYNLNFDFIKGIVKSLIRRRNELINPSPSDASLLWISPIRISKYLASLHKLSQMNQ